MSVPSVKNSQILKLGVKPPVILPNQPNFSKVAALISPKAPAVLNRDHINPNAKMYANDKIGDCSAAGIANLMSAIMALNGMGVHISTQDVINFYSLSTGYNPENPLTDEGGVLSEVLAVALSKGFLAGDYSYYPLWGSLDPSDRNAMGNVMNMMGAVYCGFGLAEADEYTVGGVWDTTTPGKQDSWSWGGHCAIIWSYTGLADTDIVEIITWGSLQKATWRWVRARIFEAHALAFRQFLSPHGTNHLGQTWNSLVSMNKAFLSGLS